MGSDLCLMASYWPSPGEPASLSLGPLHPRTSSISDLYRSVLHEFKCLTETVLVLDRQAHCLNPNG